MKLSKLTFVSLMCVCAFQILPSVGSADPGYQGRPDGDLGRFNFDQLNQERCRLSDELNQIEAQRQAIVQRMAEIDRQMDMRRHQQQEDQERAARRVADCSAARANAANAQAAAQAAYQYIFTVSAASGGNNAFIIQAQQAYVAAKAAADAAQASANNLCQGL